MIVCQPQHFSIFVNHFLKDIGMIIGYGASVEITFRIIFGEEMVHIISADIIIVGVELAGKDVGLFMKII